MNYPLSFRCAILGAIFLLAGSSVWAADYTYSETFDLSSPVYQTPPSNQIAPNTVVFNFSGAPSTAVLNPGDTLSGTLNFNRLITDTDLRSVFPLFQFDFSPSTGIFISGTIELLGTDGLPVTHTFLVNGMPLTVPIGESFSGEDRPTLSFMSLEDSGLNSISFAGLSYSLTIDDSSGPTSYTPVDLAVTGTADTITLSSVPEPCAWLCFLAGCLLLRLFAGSRLKREITQ